MKRLLPILTVLALSSLTPNLFASTASTATTSATKATAAQRKEARDTCKKEGKLGKQLNECMKEKLSQNAENTPAK